MLTRLAVGWRGVTQPPAIRRQGLSPGGVVVSSKRFRREAGAYAACAMISAVALSIGFNLHALHAQEICSLVHPIDMAAATDCLTSGDALSR